MDKDTKELLGKLKFLIKKKKSFEQVCEELQLKDYEIIGLVGLLKQDGALIDFVDGQIITLKKPLQQQDVYQIPHKSEKLKLLMISDTHLGNKADRLDILRYLYSKAEDKGVQHILHSGDFTDGHSNRPEQVYELRPDALTFDGMVQYCVDKYPEFSGKTYVIQGNHDDWEFKRGAGEIVKTIARQRDDIVYLGADVADLNIGKLKARLFHGKGGTAYSVSYKIQKYLDGIPLVERPDILQTGHIHRAFYMKQDHTHCFQTSCLEGETPFSRMMGFPNDMSCWWANVEFDDKGKVLQISPTLESFSPKKVLTRGK